MKEKVGFMKRKRWKRQIIKIFRLEICINLYSMGTGRAFPFCMRNFVETFCRGKSFWKACLQVVLLQVEPLRSLELLVQDEKAGPHLNFEKMKYFLTFLLNLYDLKKKIGYNVKISLTFLQLYKSLKIPNSIYLFYW